MNPINYSGIQSPNNVIQQAMSTYRGLADIRDDRQKQEALVQQQQQAQSMQNDLAELANNPNAGAEDYQRLMVRNPQIREHLTKSFEFMDKEEKANNVKFATEVYAATHTGNIDLAKSMLEGRRDAAKNSGDEKDAATASALIKMIEANPNTAKTTLGIVLAGAGGEEFAKIQERLANVSKTNAETETIDATRASDVDLVNAKSEAERAKANESNAGATKNIAGANKLDAETQTENDIRGAKVESEEALGFQRTQQGNQARAGAAKNFAEANQVKTLTSYKANKLVAETANQRSQAVERNRLLKGKLDKQLLDQGKTKAEINKLKIEAKKQQVELQKTNTGGIKLSKDGEKILNDSVESSVESSHIADQYESLASDIDKEIKNAGVSGKASEAIKKIFGDENNITKLRQDYRRLRNTQVLNTLPPGVASDKDIEIAMSAFPEDTANPELISGFMRGMAKLQRYEAAVSSAKAEWVNNIGNLGASQKDINIMGAVIPKGTTFKNFAKTQTQLEQIDQNRKSKGLPDLTPEQFKEFMNEALK